MKTENSEEILRGYIRVTEILNPFTNFDNIEPSILENAKIRGSIIHDYCEFHALSLFVDNPPENCKLYIESFKKWFDGMVIEVAVTEKRINHHHYKISGKFDLICRLKNDPENCWTIVDYKSPQTKSLTWQLQTAAYQLLVEDMLNFKISRRMALMLNKNGDFAKCVEYTDHERDKKLFLEALSLYNFFN